MGPHCEEPCKLRSHELDESGCREPSKVLQLRVTLLIKASGDKVIPSSVLFSTPSFLWASHLQLPCEQSRSHGVQSTSGKTKTEGEPPESTSWSVRVTWTPVT